MKDLPCVKLSEAETHFWRYVHVAVILCRLLEPPLMDPPRSGQPLYSGQAACYEFIAIVFLKAGL